MAEDFKKYEYDVIVIGAGGAGLRAAIEAARSGAKTAIITKSLLGKLSIKRNLITGAARSKLPPFLGFHSPF